MPTTVDARVRGNGESLGMSTQMHSPVDRFDALANSPMIENRPTPETTQVLKDELLFQRATQNYLWALPLSTRWA
jgi:hypothetical protein